MNIELLKELGFEIQPEQDRAVRRLGGGDEDLSIIVSSDEDIKLIIYGLIVTLDTDKSDEATIKGLITLFENANIEIPF